MREIRHDNIIIALVIIQIFTFYGAFCIERMDLLPKSHKEFASETYWEKFFRKRGQKAFEWYGEYPELCGTLHKYIKPRDKVLHIGCGNSKLTVDLFNVGYSNIVNIDISDTVIKQMKDRYGESKPDLKFIKMDMCKMDFEDGEFNVVLDKGTLDAVFTDTQEATLTTVNEMFSEIGRVLRVGGRFVCFSLAQDHILKKITEYFPNQGWMTRICYISQGEADAEKDFHMPVFAYVLTKFKQMPNMKPILEIAPFEDKVDRLESADKLIAAVKQLQNYGVIRHQLTKGTSSLEEHISLDLYDADNSKPRYTVHIVDNKTAQRNKFAIFIVPQGRENEWMFSEKEGREQLCNTAAFQRLLVVTLHRQHTYESMDQVKAELSAKVMELAPEKVNPKQVPYLSLGDSICLRTVRHEGESELNGPYVVEDVQIDADVYRLLIFLNRPDVIQAEVKLTKDIRKSKKKSAKPLMYDGLCQQHHVTMLSGLALVQDVDKVLESRLEVLLFGLKGGALPSYIHRHLQKAYVEVVEQDSCLVSAASDWFGLTPDDRLIVHTQDPVQFVCSLDTEAKKKHVIILDISSTDTSENVTCALLECSTLERIRNILDPTGLLVIHVTTRNDSDRHELMKSLNAALGSLYSKSFSTKRAEIIFAFPSARTGQIESLLSNQELSDNFKCDISDFENKYFTKSKNKLNLVDAMQGLSLQ